MPDQKKLLVSAKTTFLCAYLDAFDQFLPQCIENAFKIADNSHSSSEQSHYLAIYGVLREHHAELKKQLHNSMDKLLNRSLQTAYSTFRPAFAPPGHEGALSLVETAVFEGDLQLVAFTNRFRNEAAEQLRDLNIRIALLFEQDDIKEREVPFRPYLISRSLAEASESMAIPKELSQVLIQLLAESMEISVDGIYGRVNDFLAKNGIAAELPLRIRKSPNNKIATDRPARNDDKVSAAIGEDITASPANSGNNYLPDAGNPVNSGAPTAAAVRNAEQFLQTIKTMVDTVSNHNIAQSVTNLETDQFNNSVLRDTVASVGTRQTAASGSAIASGTHEQKVDQLLDMVKRYSEATPGFDNVAGRDVGAAEPGQQADASRQIQAINPAPPNPAGSAKSGWLSGVQAAGEVLRRFLGGGMQGNTPGGSKTYIPIASPRILTVQLADSINALLLEQTALSADIMDSNGEVRNLILEQRARLEEQTEKVDEQMTIDVVAMLFEFILRDNQVPVEVRAQLGRLQFLVLKLALRDPTLLTQKWHPMRMLINRIGSISISLKQINPGSIRMSAEICQIVETLLHDAVKNPDMFTTLFTKLLDDFDEFVATELRSKDENLNRAVQAIENVQNRTLRFTHIWAQMAEILSGLTLDNYLHEFLSNTWVQVIEHAEGLNMVRAKRFRTLVPDLIWSIAPKVDEYDRQALSAILPIMIKTLSEGMALIAWPQTQQKELLSWLFDAHTRALRSINESFQIPSLPLMHTNFERLIKNVPVEQLPPMDGAWNAAEKALMDTAIRQLDVDIQSFDYSFDQENAADKTDAAISSNADVPAPHKANIPFDENIAERLHSGIFIEIKLSKTPCRARLSWISVDTSNLILNLDEQRTPVLMSLRVFQRLIAKNRVRFIEDQPLFERAVKSLLDSAAQLDQEVVSSQN